MPTRSPLGESSPALFLAALLAAYSTYLIHFPIQLGVGILVMATGIRLPVGEAWLLIAYLAATIVFGRIVFVRFEGPMQDWIRAATLEPKRERVTA